MFREPCYMELVFWLKRYNLSSIEVTLQNQMCRPTFNYDISHCRICKYKSDLDLIFKLVSKKWTLVISHVCGAVGSLAASWVPFCLRLYVITEADRKTFLKRDIAAAGIVEGQFCCGSLCCTLLTVGITSTLTCCFHWRKLLCRWVWGKVYRGTEM